MSNGTTPPKRAWLSLRSMMVMCFMLAFFAWLNTLERSPDMGSVVRGAPLPFYWTSSQIHSELDPVTRQEINVRVSASDLPPYVRVQNLLVNALIALLVSIALASERLVFSRLRRSRPPGGPGE